MGRAVGIASVAALLMAGAGCRTYEVWQADHWDDGYRGGESKRAAVVMFSTAPRNKTFAEAMIISLQQRGVRIVEQQLVDVATQEARMTLSKQTDVVSTRDLTNRIGKQLNLDVIYYADALARKTTFDFRRKLGVSAAEEASLEARANERGSVEPDDIRKCDITVSHTVGLTIRAVDVATGKIRWVGYRFLAAAEDYKEDRPDVLSPFATVQKLANTLCDDIFGV